MNNVSEIKDGKAIMKSTIKTEKASTCFTRLYGQAAYEAWKAREAKIADLSKRKGYSIRKICSLREDSFRQMKAEGARRAAAKQISHNPVRLAA